jgi:hypothetical protein
VLGPKPFRFCNHWLLHQGFKKVVEDCWGAANITGWMGFVLKEKLKELKEVIKEWNRTEFGRMEESIRGLILNIKSIDAKGEEGSLSALEIERRRNLFKD